MNFLDVDKESHRLVLSLLLPKDLSSLAGTCKYFYQAVHDGVFAEQLWKQWCVDLLGAGVVALHAAAVPAGYRPGPLYWRNLWFAGHRMDQVRWWRKGSHQLKLRAAQASEAEAHARQAAAEDAAARIAGDNEDGLGQERRAAVLAEHAAAASGTVSLQSSLARSAHTADLLGTRIVITGGILRDGASHVDVVVVDLADISICRPVVNGLPPSTRFRHTTALIEPSPGTKLEDLVTEALSPRDEFGAGQLLFCFGGYNTTGEEFGLDSTYVLWAARDGSKYVWVQIRAQGHAPCARFHHSCNAFAGGKKVIVFGGEGYNLDDGGSPPCVYILDVDTLTWHRKATYAEAPEHSPGARSLHVTTVRSVPSSGREELVVVGGYSGSELAEMKPLTLDLDTLTWRCWPGLRPDEDSPSIALPTPRQRMGCMRVTGDWFLICGGSPTSGSFLEDVQRLHIPTLTWRPPPRESGRPSRALRRIAGHSFAGLLAFGGCIPTIMGIMPVEKLDLMLLGRAGNGLVRISNALGRGALDRVRSFRRTKSRKQAAAQASDPRPTEVSKPSSLSDGSDEESPTSKAVARNRGGAAGGDIIQDDVFTELMAEQLLSKGQRVNIGSPGTFFRPIYAAGAGLDDEKQMPMLKGKLQVINTSVLSDTELMMSMQCQLHAAEDNQEVQEEPAAGAESEVAGHKRLQDSHSNVAAGLPDEAGAGHGSRAGARVVSRAPSYAEKGKSKAPDLGPAAATEPGPSVAGDSGAGPSEEAPRDEPDATLATERFVPILLLWGQPDPLPQSVVGDSSKQPSTSVQAQATQPDSDGSAGRYILCTGGDAPVLMEATSSGVRNIIQAAKAEVFNVVPASGRWPMPGCSRAMYIVYSVRNGEALKGPNPFANVRVPWHSSWWNPSTQYLLPPGAEVDSIAAENLRYGGAPAP